MTKPGSYVVNATGDLAIHGVTKPVTTKGTVNVSEDGAVSAICEFAVTPEDHGIKIPGVVRDNIAKTISVKVDLSYDKL